MKEKTSYTGILFAIIACIIWSGNFIVARVVTDQIPPVTLAFSRWSLATLLMLPFALPYLRQHSRLIWQHKLYFFWAGLFGVAVFNTFLYIAAYTTTAINMALIGTCSSPVFSVFLAAIFLKEKVTLQRIAGMMIMLAGIVYLLVQGSLQRLMQFHFTSGDLWVLGATVFFAAYNVLVRRKPAGIHPISFLFVTFFTGTIILAPFTIWEYGQSAPIQWSGSLAGIILYLALGTSVVSFMLWNAAIARLGAARTALFGNLIPLFSSIGAVMLLQETVSRFHWTSGILIVTGLIIANLRSA